MKGLTRAALAAAALVLGLAACAKTPCRGLAERLAACDRPTEYGKRLIPIGLDAGDLGPSCERLKKRPSTSGSS